MTQIKLWQKFAEFLDKEIARTFADSKHAYQRLTEKTELTYTDNILTLEIDIDRYLYLTHSERIVLFTSLSRFVDFLDMNHDKNSIHPNGLAIIGV